MPKVEVIWDEDASHDLFAVLNPMRSTAPARSIRLMKKLVSAISRLADFPESGRQPFDITRDESVREVVVEQFRLFYSYTAEERTVHVIAVYNARQNVAVLYRQRFEIDSN